MFEESQEFLTEKVPEKMMEDILEAIPEKIKREKLLNAIHQKFQRQKEQSQQAFLMGSEMVPIPYKPPISIYSAKLAK